MKSFYALLLIAVQVGLAGCQPCEQAIQTAIAQTLAVAPTETSTLTKAPIPTHTPQPTNIPSPTATPNPCLLWDQVSSEMAGQTICVRGIIRRIDFSGKSLSRQYHWDFADNRTGFFAVSFYGGWHPATGKDMAVGDCVAITGVIQVLSNGRPYIFWGENSIFKSDAKTSNTWYYEHPDLWVMENDMSFCQ